MTQSRRSFLGVLTAVGAGGCARAQEPPPEASSRAAATVAPSEPVIGGPPDPIPALRVVDGDVPMSDEPGWGVRVRPAWLDRAERQWSEV
jgi:hypothetical protein